jgi:hypothetical protein
LRVSVRIGCIGLYPSGTWHGTGGAPTGYTVTFRYVNPTAATVQIRGDWHFARPGDLPQLAAW